MPFSSIGNLKPSLKQILKPFLKPKLLHQNRGPGDLGSNVGSKAVVEGKGLKGRSSIWLSCRLFHMSTSGASIANYIFNRAIFE